MQQKMNHNSVNRDKLQKIIDIIDTAIKSINDNKDIIIKPDAINENLHLVKNTLIVNQGYLDPKFLLN